MSLHAQAIKLNLPSNGECNSLELCGATIDTSSVLKTLKVLGDIHGFPALILIDFGATHNFFSIKLAHALGLELQAIGPLGICLGDGNRVWVTHQYCNMPLRCGSFICSVDALVYDLGPLDFILGVAWLRCLGDVLCNWQTQEIKFWQEGEHGINSPLLHSSSLRNCLEPHLVSLTFDHHEPTTLTTLQQQELADLLHTYVSLFQTPQGLPPLSTKSHCWWDRGQFACVHTVTPMLRKMKYYTKWKTCSKWASFE